MNISNELYGLVDSSYLFNGRNSINTDNGSIVYSENSMIIYHNDKSLTVNNQNFDVINAVSNDSYTILLCKTDSTIDTYNNFLYVYNYSTNSCYSILIISQENIFLNNNTLFIKDYVYTADDNSNCLVIDISNKSVSPEGVNITNYPVGSIYSAYIVANIKLTPHSYSKKAIYSYGYVYIPIDNENKIVRISNANYISSVVSLNAESFEPFNNVSNIVSCLNDDKDGSCIVACVAAGNKLMILDMIDLSSYCANTYSNNITVLKSSGIAYVFSDTISKIDPKDFEVYTMFLKDTILSYKFISIGSRMFASSPTATKELVKFDTFSTINITCIDDGGNNIQKSQIKTTMNTSTSVKAPTIEGYSVVGSNTTSITTTDAVMFVYFKYTITRATSSLKVYHMHSKDILHEEVITGVVGQSYTISSLEIPGFYYYDSINTTGTFKTTNADCIIYYTAEAFHTDNDLNSFVCVNCLNNGLHLLRKYIPVSKGLNITIDSPILKGFTPTKNTITIPSIDKDIYDVNLEYTMAEKSIPVYFKVDGNTVFENTGLVSDDEIVTLEYPDFLTPTTKYARTNGNKFIIINASPKQDISLLNVVNNNKHEKTHYITKSNKLENIVPLDLNNMEYVETFKSSVGFLTLYTMLYNQLLYTVEIVHKCTEDNAILKSEKITCKYSEIIKVMPYSDEEYSTRDNLTFKIIEDTAITINYERNSILINTVIFDVFTNKSIKTETYAFKRDAIKTIEVIINTSEYNVVYADTEINNSITVICNTDTTYLYLVSSGDIIPQYLINYVPNGFNIVNKRASDKFITLIEYDGDEILLSNKIYVVKDTVLSNTSTKTLLNSMSLEYEEILTSNISSITDPCLIIDGNYSTKTKFIKDFKPADNIIYLPLNINYANIYNTILKSYYSVISNNISITTKTVPTTPYISDLSYNKITNNLHALVDVDVNYSSFKDYTLKVYDIKDLNLVAERPIRVNTVHNFDKVAYVFNDSMSTEPDIKTMTEKENLKYYNSTKSTLIDKVLHCYLMDTIGNKTSTMHQPVLYNITASSTINSNYKRVHYNNITRYNHRFKGPRESFKFYNTHENLNDNIAGMNDILDKIKSSYKYEFNKWVE